MNSIKEVEALKSELRLRGFSDYTVRNYVFFVEKFLQHSNQEISQLEEEHVKSYLSSLISEKSMTSCFDNTVGKVFSFLGSLIPETDFFKIS
jgi:hypothetical protein